MVGGSGELGPGSWGELVAIGGEMEPEMGLVAAGGELEPGAVLVAHGLGVFTFKILLMSITAFASVFIDTSSRSSLWSIEEMVVCSH